MQIPPETMEFLKELKKNNNKDWLEKNRYMYQQLYGRFKMFAEAVAVRIAIFDDSVKKSLAHKGTVKVFRLHRDVRFSKNKLPYKTNFGMTVAPHGMESGNPGYYFHIEPGANFAGGGVYMPWSPVIKKIRKKIDRNSAGLRKILASTTFIKEFGELGDYAMLKTKPRDYSIDHPAVDLLRYKSFTAMKEISDREVLKENFIEKLLETFKKIKPLNDFLTP